MRVLILLLLAINQTAFAEGHPFLKVDNPTELQVWALAVNFGDFTNDELREIVDRTVRRARIEPVSHFSFDELFLFVVAKLNDQGAYLVTADFIMRTKKYGEVSAYPSSKTFGVGIKSALVQAVEEVVEEALDLYLQANFDH